MVNYKFKTFIIMSFVLTLTVGYKSIYGVYEKKKISELALAIKDKKTCNNVENIVECSHHEFIITANRFADPLVGQSFLAEIAKAEIEQTPEKGRFIKDQYYIFAADLYIRSLTKRQNSIIYYLPFIKEHNIDVNVAKTFLKKMDEYSNRREVDRAIASETILQEVSNFNASFELLKQKIESFQ